MIVRYNVVGYLLGEGFRNVFKNKKSTIASLCIMCATMLIFGFFFCIGENINHILDTIEGAQGISVFIKNDTSEERIKEIGEEILAIEGVNKIEYRSKEDALNQMKDWLKDKQYLLAGYDKVNIFPASYVVTLTDLNLSQSVQEQILKINDIKSIESSEKTISTLISLAKGIQIGTAVFLVLLIVISVFIISNTIKLTVHARRKEISIMKYVGATNSFIRWPFIIEGITIGILSALISVVLIGILYNIITTNIMASELAATINLSLLSFSDMFTLIMIVYVGLGIGIGIIGSTISMRKYLKV